MIRRDAIAAFVPLSVRDFYVLFVLASQPMYCCALVQAVEQRSGGLVRLEPANLYRRIHRFVDEGLLEEVAAPGGDNTDPRRRYYGPTVTGRAVLQYEVARWSSLINEVSGGLG